MEYRNYNGLPDAPVKFMSNNEEITLKPSIIGRFLTHGDPNNITPSEVVMFMNLCKYQHLNPFIGDAYIVKYGKRAAQQITSRSAFMKRADQNPHYDGIESGIIVINNEKIVRHDGAIKLPNEQLIGGWATVIRDDRKLPFHVEISFREFAKTRFNNDTKTWELQATWKQMPMYMIQKVAEVNALRTAFPESLGGLYTEDDKQEEKPEVEETSPEDDDQIADIIEKRKEKQNESKEKETIKQSNSNVSSDSSKETQKETSKSSSEDPENILKEFAESEASDNQTKSSANTSNSKESSVTSENSKGSDKNAKATESKQADLDLDYTSTTK